MVREGEEEEKKHAGGFRWQPVAYFASGVVVLAFVCLVQWLVEPAAFGGDFRTYQRYWASLDYAVVPSYYYLPSFLLLYPVYFSHASIVVANLAFLAGVVALLDKCPWSNAEKLVLLGVIDLGFALDTVRGNTNTLLLLLLFGIHALARREAAPGDEWLLALFVVLGVTKVHFALAVLCAVPALLEHGKVTRGLVLKIAVVAVAANSYFILAPAQLAAWYGNLTSSDLSPGFKVNTLFQVPQLPWMLAALVILLNSVKWTRDDGRKRLTILVVAIACIACVKVLAVVFLD
ncbi:MAG: hypothetical protein ACTSU5_11450 [Promethearchaeota archaeon]